ncbi:MAG: hypothetical protein NC299_05900 [Lachnospiraceae bacterium]|nr:hypothetical protein [Ruminococcus sp.]MCM1274885.1 hypothetical protein [Lachnospiraceae bacterium]
MNVIEITMICLAAAVAACVIIIRAVSFVKAKKCGIIRTKIPAGTTAFVGSLICAALHIMIVVMRASVCADCKAEMDDLQTLGFKDFHMEYYRLEVTVDDPEAERAATEKLLSRYREKYDRERRLVELYALAAAGFVGVALLNGAYITKEGVLMFGDLKPRKTAAVVEDGKFRFRSADKREFTMLTLPASEENLRLYSVFTGNNTVKE